MITPMLTQHYPMLQRNLFYTGVTRGKRLHVGDGRERPSKDVKSAASRSYSAARPSPARLRPTPPADFACGCAAARCFMATIKV